jgi:hypothetical protein
MAEAVARRLREPAVGEAEARAVAEFTRRELSWERVAARMEALYADVVGRVTERKAHGAAR